MAHVSAIKKEEVGELKKLIDSQPIVGLVNIEGIKARQLQTIRHVLRGKAVIRGSKNTLLGIALKKAKQDVTKLGQCLEGSASLICTDMNPFQLNRLLEESRTPTSAKPGDVAPEDIVISAGDTGFPPGPLVGELQRAGVPARIERGSIIVQKDHVFVKEGDTISDNQARILQKLGIEPMTAGLELLGVCEEGTFFEPSILHVDIEKTVSQIGTAHQQALAVGVKAGIISGEIVPLLIQKAVRQAAALALEATIVAPDTISNILGKASGHALALQQLITGESVQDQPGTGIETKKEKGKEKKEDIEEPETEAEEEALEGLGSLFG
jgi:large subunit ribosomal protein L10